MTEAAQTQLAPTNRVASFVLWALCLAWACVIFWFSSRTGSQIPGRFSELGHFGEYFVFGALLYAALWTSGFRREAAAAAIVVASLYGVSDELHQHFVATRTPDVVDWGVDTLGAACGVLAARTIRAHSTRLRTDKPAEANS